MLKRTTLFILILNWIINLNLTLNSSEFCLNSQEKCNGLYDANKKFRVLCNTPKCDGKYSFPCMAHCALTSQACIELIKITFAAQNLQNNTAFKGIIKNCTDTSERKTNDICFKVFAGQFSNSFKKGFKRYQLF